MVNAISRAITVFSETDDNKIEVEIPYDFCDDDITWLPASEALGRGIDVPPDWIRHEAGASPMGAYYKARIAANGLIYNKETDKYNTPNLVSLAEQRLAASVGMKCAMIMEDQVPEEYVPSEYSVPSPSTAIEEKIPVPAMAELLYLPKTLLSPAKVAVPHSPPPSIMVNKPNEVANILLRCVEEQKMYMLPDDEPYFFNTITGCYQKLCEGDDALKLMEHYASDILYASNPAKLLKDASYLLKNMSFRRVDPPDPDPFIWAFKDFIVDIRSGKMIPNSGNVILLSALQCNYIPEATCPVFDQLIETVSYGREDVKQLLWEVIAYILSPDTKAKHFFVFGGVKDSGKSLIAGALTELIGKNLCSCLNTSDLDKQFAIGDLYGKRLNVCMDLADEVLSNKAVGFIKMLTGGDMIHADRKFKDAIEFRNTAKLLLGSNFTLKFKTEDAAVRRRLVLVPFRYSIPEEEQNTDLKEHIRLEFPGIAIKAMRVFLDLKRRNLVFTKLPESVEKCSVAVVSDMTLQAVIREGFEFTRNREDFLITKDAYDHYCQTCGRFGVSAIEHDSFSSALKEFCLDKKKQRVNGEPEHCFFGVKKK